MRNAVAALLMLLVTLASARAQHSAMRDAAAEVVRRDRARPRLVIVISIDQFRADYLTRLGDLFLPAEQDHVLGGFQYLMHHGAYFVNGRYEHYPLFTGPGHAVILSGACPDKTGIISNDWWDVANRRYVYCVEDPRFTVVGAAENSHARPMGPANLRCSTVGDELKLASFGKAKVITLAVKDRAAILMGGHAQDLSLWFDSTGGRWISSTAFCHDGQLPEWAQKLNDEHIPDRMLGQQWTPSLPADVLAARSTPPKRVGSILPKSLGTAFPHGVGAGDYHAFIYTPAANAFVFESAERAISGAGLGQDDVPDVLAVSLSTNDYVGHAFGPYSPEMLDLTVQTDRQLSGFVNFVAKSVPGGLPSVVWVLTGDHGIPPVPENAADPSLDIDAGRFKVKAVLETISKALTERFGEPAGGTWYGQSARGSSSGAWLDGFIYLNPDALAKAVADGKSWGATRRDVERAACDAVNSAKIPGVYACYGKTQILEGAIADNDIARHLARAIYPSISSDLIVLPEQNYLQDPMPEGHATTHGTPYAFDVHVPVIIAAPDLIRPGVYADAVSPADIAPTLSLLLGIEFPSGCDGQPLLPALMP